MTSSSWDVLGTYDVCDPPGGATAQRDRTTGLLGPEPAAGSGSRETWGPNGNMHWRCGGLSVVMKA